MLKSKKHTKNKISVGSMLIAQPFWQDDTYKRSVIILLNHDSQGSTGLILNKQSQLMINDTIPEFDLYLPVYYGGPHNTHSVSYLHSNHDLSDSTCLVDDLYWGGDAQEMAQMICSKKLDINKVRFFAGFTEWDPGQLESEINDNKWWLLETYSVDVFVEHEKLWSYKLLADGNTFGIFSDETDFCLN